MRRQGGEGTLPAVRTVFCMDSIIRLSPEACSRTLVRSSGLYRGDGKAKTLGRRITDGGRVICSLGYRCRDCRGDT